MASSAKLHEPLQGIIPGLALYAVPLAAWGLRRWSPRAGAWALVSGCVLIDLILVAWSGLGAALCLVMIPAGLAALSISMLGGIAVATVCTFLYRPCWRATPHTMSALPVLAFLLMQRQMIKGLTLGGLKG